ncbi:hypothetical protein ACLOJK_033494 [Asimina triloba]
MREKKSSTDSKALSFWQTTGGSYTAASKLHCHKRQRGETSQDLRLLDMVALSQSLSLFSHSYAFLSF